VVRVADSKRWRAKPQPRVTRLLWLALASGVLTGVGAVDPVCVRLDDYSRRVVPVFFSGQRRVLHMLAALGAFVVVLIPWVIRNYAVSGTLFGTAGFCNR